MHLYVYIKLSFGSCSTLSNEQATVDFRQNSEFDFVVSVYRALIVSVNYKKNSA